MYGDTFNGNVIRTRTDADEWQCIEAIYMRVGVVSIGDVVNVIERLRDLEQSRRDRSSQLCDLGTDMMESDWCRIWERVGSR
jgi:hypothetical protein